MNFIDIFVLTTLLITTFIGFKNGILNMIVPIITVIIGLSFSSRVSEPIGRVVGKIVNLGDFQQYLVFAVFFIILLIIGTWIAKILKSIIMLLPFGGLLNRVTGAIAGLLIGLLISTGLITGVQKIGLDSLNNPIENSAISKPIIDKTSTIMRLTKILPSDWRKQFYDTN
jgi:uncharacterized membrane protein required for colicin V production